MKYSNKKKPLVCMLSSSDCYKKTKTMNVLGILWHGTGCYNPWIGRYVFPSDFDPKREELKDIIGEAHNWRTDWNHYEFEPGTAVGVNAFIGLLDDETVAAVQTLPWNYVPWGCGNGPNGSCNYGWIQFEACQNYGPGENWEPAKTNVPKDEYFELMYKEACELTAYLCVLYGLDPMGYVDYKGKQVPVILDHAESHSLGFGSNHGDITSWLSLYGKTMDDARKDVAKLVQQYNDEVTNNVVYDEPQTQEQYIWYYILGILNALEINNAKLIASAIVGGIIAESEGSPILLNPDYTNEDDYIDMKMSSELYTLRIDNFYNLNNEYRNFPYDGAGYGIIQYDTYNTKIKLLEYSKSQKQSIGNLKLQLDFLMNDLQFNHKEKWTKLLKSTTTDKASGIIHEYFNSIKADSCSLARIKNRAAKLYKNYEKDYIKLEYDYEPVESNELVIDVNKEEFNGESEQSYNNMAKKPFPMYRGLEQSLCKGCGQFHLNCICEITDRIIMEEIENPTQQQYYLGWKSNDKISQTFPIYKQSYNKGNFLSQVQNIIFYYSPNPMAMHIAPNSKDAFLTPLFTNQYQSPAKVSTPFHYCIGKNEKGDIITVNTCDNTKSILQGGNGSNGTLDDKSLHVLICGYRINSEEELLQEIGNCLQALTKFYNLDNQIINNQPQIISIDEAISMGYAINEQYLLNNKEPWNVFINKIRNSINKNSDINYELFYVYDFNPSYSTPKLIGQFYDKGQSEQLQKRNAYYGVFKYNDEGILTQLIPEDKQLILNNDIYLNIHDKWADNTSVDKSLLNTVSHRILPVSQDKYAGYFIISNQEDLGLIKLAPR